MGARMAPVPGEDPLFTDEDVEELLDYLEWKDSLCPGGCGQPQHLSFSKALQWEWVADVYTCHACAAATRAAQKFTSTPGADRSVVRRRRATRPT